MYSSTTSVTVACSTDPRGQRTEVKLFECRLGMSPYGNGTCGITAPGPSIFSPRLLVALAVLMLVAWSSAPLAVTAGAPIWVRLDLVENTAEGPAFDRCQIEDALEGRRVLRWRIFYGEATVDGAGSGWAALRSRSACTEAASGRTASPWRPRGAPYLLVDVSLEPVTGSEREVILDASLTIRKLTGFAKAGSPTYEQRTEKRTVRVPSGGSTVIPVLVAGQKEISEFRVRELLLRLRASDTDTRPGLEYGEVAVTADVPRAAIFLDGGFVGRTSADGPVVLGAVRTGERRVVVSDPSGRETHTAARVEKAVRASVSLTLLPRPTGGQAGGLRSLGRNAQGSEEFWREKDEAVVVRVPGGEFRMGSAEGEGEPAERPQHVVRVRGFLMDKTEVTWGQFHRFAVQANRPLPKAPVWGMREAFPASNVTWEDADAFCAWAGGRLPTEAEWERAARGDDTRRYPWGNDWNPARCNTRDGGPHAPTAAASHPDCVSPYGVLDLAGSMWEWCRDWYDASYYAKSLAENPTGPETGQRRVVRGGAWMNPSSWTRTAFRQGRSERWADPLHGFRCVLDDAGGTAE